jgi:hypothetical protein
MVNKSRREVCWGVWEKDFLHKGWTRGKKISPIPCSWANLLLNEFLWRWESWSHGSYLGSQMTSRDSKPELRIVQILSGKLWASCNIGQQTVNFKTLQLSILLLIVKSILTVSLSNMHQNTVKCYDNYYAYFQDIYFCFCVKASWPLAFNLYMSCVIFKSF